MVQVKTFETNDKNKLENEINSFIERQKLQQKQIVSASYSAYMCGYTTYYTALVMYNTSCHGD